MTAHGGRFVFVAPPFTVTWSGSGSSPRRELQTEMPLICGWRQLARSRRSKGRGACPLHLGSSDFDVLGDRKRIIDFGTEMTDRTHDLRVPERQVDGARTAGALVDQSRLGPAHRMRVVEAKVQSGAGDPLLEQSRVLSGRQRPIRRRLAQQRIDRRAPARPARI